MEEMFRSCRSLKSLDLSNFNIKNVINMHGMFLGCKSLKTLDLSNLNGEKLTDMNEILYEC